MLLKVLKLVFHRIENIVGKEENAGDQHFLLFPQCFKRLFPPVHQKSSLCGKGLRENEKMLVAIKFEMS